MDQDSIEDVILNGNVQTPIKDSEIIGRSGAKMLGMVSDSGMEYQSFTEESAMEDNEGDYQAHSKEYKDAEDETKAFYSNEIVLPKISSAEHVIINKSDVTGSLLLPSSEEVKNNNNNNSKKNKKKNNKKTKKSRGGSRTSSKEKKPKRTNSKDTKNKKRSKRKKKKKKRKKRRQSKSRLTGAEVRLRMDPYALACAMKWEELGDQSPLDGDIEQYSISYPPGPMGITFDWRNGLVVMALRTDMKKSKVDTITTTTTTTTTTANNNNNNNNNNIENVNTTVTKRHPTLGSRLLSINNTSVVNLNFRENVDMLRNLADTDRTLIFQSWKHVLMEKNETKISSSTSQPTLKFPSIKPSSSEMKTRAQSATSLPQHNLDKKTDNNNSKDRPISASKSTGNLNNNNKRPIIKTTNAFERKPPPSSTSTANEKNNVQIQKINERADAYINQILDKDEKKEDENESKNSSTELAIVEKKKQSGTKKGKSKKKSSKKDKKSNGGAGLSNVLAKQLEKKAKEKKKKEEEAKKKALEKPKDPYVGPLQIKITEMLKAKFDAKHIKIVNRTYYDRNMKRLGPKKMRYASVKQNQNTGEWDPRIYILKFDEHSGGGKPEETWLGVCKTENKAWKKIAMGKNKRDRGVFEPVPIIPYKPDEEHFQILIVSEKFRHKTIFERVAMVYHELIELLWHPRDMSYMFGKASKWKKYGTVGYNVFNTLPEFRLLPADIPLRFIISAKTPGQWNPSEFQTAVSERLGLSHTSLGMFAVNPRTKPGMKDVRKLNPQEATEDKDKAKPAPIFPHVKGKAKTGARMGHFFHGLSEETRAMMDRDRKDRDKKAIQDALKEADKAGVKKAKKKTGLAAKLDRLASMYDENAGKTSAIKQYQATRRTHIYAAKTLQTLFRKRYVPRVIKWMIKRHRAVTNISRVYKGYCGRLYAVEFRRLRTEAAIIIQSAWRMVLGKRIAEEYRRVRVEAVLKIQPVVRGWFARRFVAWKRANDKIAIQMEKVVRGFLARCRFKRLLARKFHETVVVPAVVIIQALYRGHVGREIVRSMQYGIWLREVATPATIVIQRLHRGNMARKRYEVMKDRFYAAIEIQRVFRSFKKRRFYKLLLRDKLEYEKSIIIQAAARRFLAVRVVARRRKEKYFHEVTVPSAILLQQAYRTHRAMKLFKVARVRYRAAIKIQGWYRGCLASASMKEMFAEMEKAYRDKLATALQSAFRAYKARCRFQGVKNAWIARRIAATEKIQSGWRFYLANKHVYAKRLRRKAEAVWEHIAWCEEESEIIIEDLDDVMHEDTVQKHVKKRAEKFLKELKADRREWEKRLPVVEKELEELTEEDIEHGWGEHFEMEWDMLSESMPMNAEDMRGRQLQIDEATDKIAELHEERDELELDIDDMGMQELEQFEKIRRMEIEECERKCEIHWNNEERKQRNKWKIKSRRENKVKKLSAKAAGLVELEAVGIDKIQTISHEKRDRARRHQKQRQRQRTLEQNLLIKRQVEQNGALNTKIRDAYTEIVSGVNELLSDFSYGIRRPKDDIRGNKSVFCDRCGKVLCSCNDNGPIDTDDSAVDEDRWISSDDEW